MLVPAGTRAPELCYDSMEDALARAANELGNNKADATAVPAFLACSQQPQLLRLLLGGLMSAVDGLPKNRQPDAEAMVGITLLLRVILDELDIALRR